MAYDDSRQQLVLFGGGVRGTQGYQANVDTWEWNGTEWTQVADIGPDPRMSCALTYDTVRQSAVLFGGYDHPNKYFDDTWEWDGTEWTQIADTGPPPRLHPAMAFDRERECLVLFGGWGGGSGGYGWLGDTWEWRADTGWVKRQDIGPHDMAYPKMVYTGEHTVLVGAPEAGSAAEHTWEWDGRLWTQRQDMGPPFRSAYALAHDSQRDRVVLYGGQATAPPYPPVGDTWELVILEQ
jgi:hypothetical protein